MYEKINIKQKNVFSYLFVTKVDDMEIVYDEIKNNEIKCNDEYLDKCQLIKKLFLKKIKKGMNYQTYVYYKEVLKRLDTSANLYIDNLISIFKLSDKKLMKMIYKKQQKGNYSCLTPTIRNKEIKMTPALAIDMLNENYRSMKLTVSKYVSSITKDMNNEEVKSLYDDIVNNNDLYSIILKEIIIDKYSYLENSIYKVTYLNFLNELNNIFKYFVKSVMVSPATVDIYNDKISYYNHPRARYHGYGYYKKYKDYQRY